MITVQLQIRRATKYDVLKDNNLRMGLTYYVKSILTKGMFCGPMVTTDYTDREEFSAWYKQGRIYVPISALDNKIKIVK